MDAGLHIIDVRNPTDVYSLPTLATWSLEHDPDHSLLTARTRVSDANESPGWRNSSRYYKTCLILTPRRLTKCQHSAAASSKQGAGVWKRIISAKHSDSQIPTSS